MSHLSALSQSVAISLLYKENGRHLTRGVVQGEYKPLNDVGAVAINYAIATQWQNRAALHAVIPAHIDRSAVAEYEMQVSVTPESTHGDSRV